MERKNHFVKSYLSSFFRSAGVATLFAALLLTGLFCARPARAATDPTASPAIRVAVWNRGGRFDYGADGSLSGYDAELVSRLSEFVDRPVEYIPVSGPAEAIRGLDAGTLDLITSMRRTADRERDYLYSGLSSGFTYSGLIALSSREDLVFGDTAAFQSARVGYEGGSGSKDAVLDYLHNTCHISSPQPFESVDTLRTALHAGAVDLMATGANNVAEGEKIVARFAPEEVYFLTSKRNYELMDQVDSFLTHLTINVPDYLSTLQNRYFPMYANTEFTKEELDYIASSGTITVGIPDGRCPISYTDSQTGELQGIAVDMMHQLSLATGLHFRFASIPSGVSVQEAIEEDAYDIVLPTVDESLYHGETPLYISDSLMDANVTIATSNLNRLSGKSSLHLGVAKELYGLAAFLKTRYPEHSITTYEDQKAALKALRSGEIDAIINNLYVWSYLLQNPHYSDLKVSPSVSVTMPYCIAGRKDRTSSLLFTVLDKGIHKLSDIDKNSCIIKYTSSRLYEYTLLDYIHMEKLPLSIIGVVLLCILVAALLLARQKDRYYSEVAIANEQLKKANMAKTDFLSRMSHDIRTPMNAIIGISLLGEDGTSDSNAAREFRKIQTAGHYLLGLINDLLDMRNIEEGRVQLHEGTTTLMEIRDGVMRDIKPALEERSMTLIFEEKPCPSCRVLCDPLRFKQIHVSILGNAIKFSEPGSQIHWTITTLTMVENRILIREEIQDSGCGMSKEFIAKAFLPFEQEQNKFSYERPGTGLGLAFCKSIIDQMGGTIAIESELGVGTTVTLDYSLQVVDQPVCTGAEDPSSVLGTGAPNSKTTDDPSSKTTDVPGSKTTGDSNSKSTDDPGSKAADTSSAAPGTVGTDTSHAQKTSAPNPLSGCRVLMCEDHPVNREIAKRILEKRGMVITCAENGQEGVERFRQSDPGEFDLILMDIKMPVMDGLTAARNIRALARQDASVIPIIALTANAYDSDRQNSLDAGMDAHLAKPINPTVLYETLERQLALRKSTAQNRACEP